MNPHFLRAQASNMQSITPPASALWVVRRGFRNRNRRRLPDMCRPPGLPDTGRTYRSSSGHPLRTPVVPNRWESPPNSDFLVADHPG